MRYRIMSSLQKILGEISRSRKLPAAMGGDSHCIESHRFTIKLTLPRVVQSSLKLLCSPDVRDDRATTRVIRLQIETAPASG